MISQNGKMISKRAPGIYKRVVFSKPMIDNKLLARSNRYPMKPRADRVRGISLFL